MSNRCRSRQIFGVREFFPISPNLPEKFLCAFLPTNFLRRRTWRLVFGVTSTKKVLILFFLQTLDAIFLSQTTLGAIFARIFDKSKLLGCAYTPVSYTTGLVRYSGYHHVILVNITCFPCLKLKCTLILLKLVFGSRNDGMLILRRVAHHSNIFFLQKYNQNTDLVCWCWDKGCCSRTLFTILVHPCCKEIESTEK